MSIVFAMFYGLIQGLSEFLPISSSGHLAIFHSLLGDGMGAVDSVAFDVLLHLGTLGAVLLVYRCEVGELVRGLVSLAARLFVPARRREGAGLGRRAEEKTVLMLMLATIPMAGALFFDRLLEGIYRDTRLIGAVLVGNGLFLLASDRFPRGKTEIADLKPRHALLIGIGQLCAVVPGLSRSGTTVSCGMLCGFTREFAVRFSFLLSIPAILGANLLKVPTLLETAVSGEELVACAVGMLTAFISGICAMKLLRWLAGKKTFAPFGWYCLAVGAAAVLFG